MADAASSLVRTSERTEHLTRIFRPRKPIESYLDLGCGTGTITKEIQEFYNIPLAYGVDLHPPPEGWQEESNGNSALPTGGLSHGENGDAVPAVAHEDPPLREPTPPPPPPPPPPIMAPVAIDFDDDIDFSSPPTKKKEAAAPPPPPPKEPATPPRPVIKKYEYRQLLDDTIPLPSDSIDLITVFMAIHHFENFHRMIEELKRVLKPNGLLFIREHDVARDDGLLKKTLDNMHSNFSDHMVSGEINYWPREELRKALTEEHSLKHVWDDDYPEGVPNPQAIYHSLYGKSALENLKYVPPSDRVTKKASPLVGGGGGSSSAAGSRFPAPRGKAQANPKDRWSNWRN